MVLSMKRIVSVLTVTALTVALLMVMAIPAFATNYENANCIGYIASEENQRQANKDSNYHGVGGYAYTAPNARSDQGINEKVHDMPCSPYSPY